jgi:L-cystine uptake protein TcyP (sodium:dicarboxylate symporter family)
LFDTIVAVLIVVCAVNSIFHIFTDSKLAQIFDTFFIWLFLGELIVRIIGIGP